VGWRASLAAAGVWLLFGCGTARSAALLVAAAVSLTEALEEIASGFERESGTSVTFTFGASNALARQIAAGAPADVFISADEAQMAFATRAGAVDASTIVPIVENGLVVVVRGDAAQWPRSAAELVGATVRRVAIADPEAVPAGVYARRYFATVGLWGRLNPKVVPTGSVRGALAAVRSGAADAGVVYQSDLVHGRGLRAAFAIPRADGPRIVYPAAVTRAAREPHTARAFLEHLLGEKAQRTFARHGFIPLR